MHAHGHDHSRVHDRRLLRIALLLILGLMAGEIAAGIVAGSLALLADAGHLLTDAAALGGALVAAALPSARRAGPGRSASGARRSSPRRRTGSRSCSSASGSSTARCGGSSTRPRCAAAIVLVVALVGIAVNLVATAVLARGDRESLNMRGAFLHVATDLAAFAGTAVAGALVLATGWNRFDPIAGLLVAALLFRSSWSLLRDSGRIFLEASPAGIDPDAVARALADDGDVVGVHDLHVWTVTSGFPALAAHVLVSPDADCHAARRRLQQLLEERFHLHHVTLQVDHVARREQPVELHRG